MSTTILERVSIFVRAVFLFCLAALIPLGIITWYSGPDASHEARQIYDVLEKILVFGILACIFVWVIAEGWRELRFIRAQRAKKGTRRV
jgi:hypothetical protein